MSSRQSHSSSSPYNSIFWLAYLANLVLVTGNAFMFRFAEFIAFLGGTEHLTGTIVSLSAIGALLARMLLGQSIDRFGTRRLWIGTSLLFTLGGAVLFITSSLGWTVYTGRAIFAMGLAGMFTCSMVHIQNHSPPDRRTEIIGMLGSSGFLGIILGAQLGDLFLFQIESPQQKFQALFGGVTVIGFIYLTLVLVITKNDHHRKPKRTFPIYRLMFRYWPGAIIIVALMMGVAMAVTTVFLTRFATSLHLRGVGTFFTAYAISAFIFRMMSRKWSEVIGSGMMVLLGLSGQMIGFCLLPFVTQEWHFILPANCCGFGHALLFPVVVSLGSGSFPPQYRGTGTTIVLGFIEAGTLMSGHLFGWVIDSFGFDLFFLSAAGMAFSSGVLYKVVSKPVPAISPIGETEKASHSERTTETEATPELQPVKV